MTKPTEEQLERIIRPMPRASYEVHCHFSHLERQLEGFEQDYGLDLMPDFQRGHVWTQEQQERWIEAVLRGAISTSGLTIQFNSPAFGHGSATPSDQDLPDTVVCVDGLQRLTSVRRLFDNRESEAWTRNCECPVSWTPVDNKNENLGGDVMESLRFSKSFLYIGGANSGGQLVCPPEFANIGEPVRQPAATAACGGRPQVEERVPVPLGARVARAGWLSTGGRALRDSPIPAFVQARTTFKASQRVVLY